MSLPTTRTMQEIIRFCARALPALDGDTSSEISDSRREADGMALIFRSLAAAYPEAGAVYWGCRTWLLWMWQPVYLGAWSASVLGVSPDFSGFRHSFDGLFTSRFCIAAQDCAVGDRQKAVFKTAAHLKTYMQDALPLIQPHYPLSGKLAAYFLGDAVLNALSAAHALRLLPRNETETLAHQWQEALAVRCNGSLVWDGETQGFQTKLAACCQHYRREDGDFCSGCPKTRR